MKADSRSRSRKWNCRLIRKALWNGTNEQTAPFPLELENFPKTHRPKEKGNHLRFWNQVCSRCTVHGTESKISLGPFLLVHLVVPWSALRSNLDFSTIPCVWPRSDIYPSVNRKTLKTWTLSGQHWLVLMLRDSQSDLFSLHVAQRAFHFTFGAITAR